MNRRNERRMDDTKHGGKLRRLFVVCVLACGAHGAAFAQTQDAKAVLKSMTQYVSSQRSVELTFDSDIEIITPQLEKIQFTNSGDVLLVRPDKLRTHRVGGYSDVTLFYDGKSANIYSKGANAYAPLASAGSVDQLLVALRSGQGSAMPGADLLLTNAYDVLVADVMEAKYMGRGIVDGVECEHLAFRNFDTDWQLWVEVGARPIPRKMVITSKTMSSAPQYTIRIKSWKVPKQPARDAFTFVPSAGMTQMKPWELALLDEVPPGEPPPGASK